MKRSTKARIELRRKETGRLWAQSELIDFLQISGPTFFKIEEAYKKRGGRLRRLHFGALTIRYLDEDVRAFLADAMAQAEAKPHPLRVKKAAKETETAAK